MKQEIERGYHPRATGPIKLYLFKHEALGEITANGRSKYEAVVAAAHKWGVPWTRVAKEAEIILLTEEEKRSCENCGNIRCASSVVAFWWDECVESGFTKHWRPKEEGPENEV